MTAGASRAHAMPTRVCGRKPSPVVSARKWSLHVQRQELPHRVEAGPSQQHHRIAHADRTLPAPGAAAPALTPHPAPPSPRKRPRARTAAVRANMRASPGPPRERWSRTDPVRGRSAGRSRSVATTVTALTGTLMSRIHRQDNDSVSTPPIRLPAAPPCGADRRPDRQCPWAAGTLGEGGGHDGQRGRGPRPPGPGPPALPPAQQASRRACPPDWRPRTAPAP